MNTNQMPYLCVCVYVKSERSQSRRQHHEWPQTKDDFDQNDFVPKEKPHQVRLLDGRKVRLSHKMYNDVGS